MKTYNFIIENIGNKKHSLIQIFCVETKEGEVISGHIKKNYKFNGTWKEVKEDVIKRGGKND